MLLGAFKLLMGLFVGTGLLRWLQSFPTGLLGILVGATYLIFQSEFTNV